MESILRSLLVALPDDIESFRTIVRSVNTEAWPSLLVESARHGVQGILAPYLDESLLPAPIWESYVHRNAVRELWYENLGRSLEDAVSLFDGAGIRVCALKGPALSSRLYGNPTARSSADLDLLVAPEDLDRSVAAVRARGYSGESDATASYRLRHGHHLHFEKPGTASIELHFQAYAGFGVTVPSAALMERAREYRFSENGTVLVPSAEDELMYLAVHAAGHSFIRLLWLYDMKILIGKSPRLNWDHVIARSRNAGIATAVGYAIGVLARWLEVPVASVAASFPRGIRVAAADAMLATASEAWSKSPLNNLKGLVFTSMLCDRPASTAWLLQHHVLRSARRRVYRLGPRLLPASWSG